MTCKLFIKKSKILKGDFQGLSKVTRTSQPRKIFRTKENRSFQRNNLCNSTNLIPRRILKDPSINPHSNARIATSKGAPFEQKTIETHASKTIVDPILGTITRTNFER